MNKQIENVLHLKKKLEKGVGYEKATGVGKTVRNLSKQHIDTDIGKTAKLLCLTWKAIVKEQQEQEEQQELDNQYNDEPDVNEEANEESDPNETIHSNNNYERNDPKIKREYNESDEEVNQTKSESKSDKRKSNNNEKYDKKHKKHKSSHKSRESESISPKTEFETLLGLNDQIISSKNKKSSSHKKSEKEKDNKKSDYHSSEGPNCRVKSESMDVKERNNHSSHKKPEKEKDKKTDYHSSERANSRPKVKSEPIDDKERNNHSSHRNSTQTTPKALDSRAKLKSLEHSDILSSLPTPNYKPLPNRELIDERVEANRRKTVKVAEDLSINVQSKKGRTAVFAGRAQSKSYTHVVPLEELAIRVLMDNIDKIYYLGDAPYYLLKQVLQKCNTRQLTKIERLNPHIMDETDELWVEFCKKEFKGREPDEDEDENWRDLYNRCVRERDDKLKNITKHITHRQAKALPVRQTQFSENVKTPREILRKQERSGISQSSGGSGPSHSSGSSSGNYVKIVPEKPKVAPLMKKALKLQRARYRR